MDRKNTLEKDFDQFCGRRCEALTGALDPAYEVAGDKISAIEEKISGQLDQTDKKLLRELNDLAGEQEAYIMDWAYFAGLRDGFQLKKLLEVE